MAGAQEVVRETSRREKPFRRPAAPSATLDLLQALDYADPDDLGGASQVALALGEELAGLGWRVRIFAGCKGRDGEEARRRGMEFRHFHSPLSKERTLARNVRLVAGVARSLQRRPPALPDLLACHQPFITWTLRRVARLVPLVYYFHSPWSEEHRARRGRGAASLLARGLRLGLERWALSRARLIVVGSAFMRRELARVHPSLALRKEVEVLPNGVDTKRFRPRGDRIELRRELGLPPRGRIVITTRRLEDRMGLEQLIAAAELASAAVPELLVVIVGRGRLEQKLRDEVSRRRLEGRVRFWGYAKDEELPRLYGAADLFVLPTRALEGFGLVTLEACACGLPVAATPVGAIPETVGRLGPEFLTAGTEPPEIAERIVALLTGPALDPARFRAFAVENYSWRRTAERFAEQALRVVGAARAH